MTIALIAIAAIAVIAITFAVVMRGSLGLLRKRLDEDPELAKPVPNDKLDDDSLPVDVDY